MRRGIILAVVVCVGCGGGKGATVDAGRARETVKTALDGWKAGKKPEDLAAASPAITVQDFDWMAGGRLVEYQLIDNGTPQGANLHIKALLTVRDAKGGSSKKAVTYIVSTDPALTVFRSLE